MAEASGRIVGGGRIRAVVEGLSPQIDCGRFPVKRVEGDRMVVEVDAFGDGHDAVRCVLLHRREGERDWCETPMEPLGNDRWRGAFPLPAVGGYLYTAEAWVDPWLTWRRDLTKRLAADQDVRVDLAMGAQLLEVAARRADEAGSDRDRDLLRRAAARLRKHSSADSSPPADEVEDFLRRTAEGPAARHPDREHASRYPRALRVLADRERAGFSAWYEFFPRSASPVPGEHGTFRDAERMVPYIRDMGFDVVYLPPIHPVGATNRKGPNNVPGAGPDDPGSPWAIGAPEGGHTAVHPALGTLADFRRFRERVEETGMEVALDVAFQCSPDHPWVEEHPEWFRSRPDGTIQYAENPPKKYQDIYPLDFESEDWASLWTALRDVFLFWIDEGVKIFRVDNPHTKAFPFWEWAITDIRGRHPDVLMLSEAFTRPRVMYRLAKLGFHQSYTYFTWRNEGPELREYLTELTATEVREFFRPNFWPNTPDILNEFLQTGGPPAFRLRAVLAATLSANWGIYGPAFELGAATPREPGSEEYLDSEKYQLGSWDLDDSSSHAPLLARLNRIRRENRALQRTEWLDFHPTDNDALLAYSKRPPPWEDDPSSGASSTFGGPIFVVVNLDPRNVQSGWVDVDAVAVGIEDDAPFQVHDLLSGETYDWTAGRNFVRLDPTISPAHVMRVTRDDRAPRPSQDHP